MAYSEDKAPLGLTALTALAAGDGFVVGDADDATEVAKYITKANLITDLGTSFAAALGADDNYVTDAEKTKLANLSGTNTGDQDLSGYVTKATYDAHTVLAATTDNTPVALTVGEQTVVGRVTGGNIAALAIDSDLSSVSANDDTLPSAKATKAALDLKAPLASPTFTGTVTLPVGLTGVIRTDSGVVSVDTDVTDIVAAASDTAAGKVELAIGSEVTTGTDATRAITPDALAGSEPGKRSVYILVSDPGGSAITTGDGKACVAIDTTINGMNLVAAKSYCTTVSSSGNPTVQLRRSRRTNATTRSDADMLSTALSIDANEFESADATTAVGINTSNDDVQTGDMIFVDIDTAGTGCKGLGVLLTFQTP